MHYENGSNRSNEFQESFEYIKTQNHLNRFEKEFGNSVISAQAKSDHIICPFYVVIYRFFIIVFSQKIKENETENMFAGQYNLGLEKNEALQGV